MGLGFGVNEMEPRSASLVDERSGTFSLMGLGSWINEMEPSSVSVVVLLVSLFC